jgi:hypothetical protein
LEGSYLAEIASDAVRQDNNYHVAFSEAQLLGGLDHGCNSTPAAPSAENPFLCYQSTSIHECLSVLRFVPLIDNLPLKNFGDKIVADALYFVPLVLVGFIKSLWEGQDAAFRVCADDLNARRMLPETSGDASHGPSGSGASHQHVYLAVGLLPDLLGSSKLMGEWIVGI